MPHHYPLTPEAHVQRQEQPSVAISPYCLLNREPTHFFFDGTTARYSCAPFVNTAKGVPCTSDAIPVAVLLLGVEKC